MSFLNLKKLPLVELKNYTWIFISCINRLTVVLKRNICCTEYDCVRLQNCFSIYVLRCLKSKYLPYFYIESSKCILLRNVSQEYLFKILILD